jgi:hypothetical protein
MYGMVNKAIEQMVVMHHGEDAWEKIKVKAGTSIEVFISNESYPDELTYALVAAASDLLNVPQEELLLAFGEHWILHTALESYGGLMQAAGRSVGQFLSNLPNFHARVSMIFPKLKPPHFECTDITEHDLNLHYHSDRPGLQPFVIGLMHGLGKMFKTPVQVKQIQFKTQGHSHDVFSVAWS